MEEFAGKVAVVTGAAQGIGETYAKALAAEGAATGDGEGWAALVDPAQLNAAGKASTGLLAAAAQKALDNAHLVPAALSALTERAAVNHDAVDDFCETVSAAN